MAWKKVKPLAIDVFTGSLAQCREHLEIITVGIEDHLGASPDDVDWGNAGDARHLESELQKIVTWLIG